MAKKLVRTETENGGVTYKSSLNSCVDYFFTAGAMRSESEARIIEKFENALKEDPLVASKLLFWTRDVRGGAGERRVSKVIFKHLAETNPDALERNLPLIAKYGRWDDIQTMFGTKLEAKALDLIKEGLANKDGLCAKWLPDVNNKNKDTKARANKIRKHLGLAPKEYRKLRKELSDTVEQKMCAKEFDKIDYSKLPSVASARYRKAFGKNDPKGYGDYVEGLEKGTTTINAGAVYPYDVIKGWRGNRGWSNTSADISVTQEAQWKALPDFLDGSTEKILPMCDLSGSMYQAVGGNANLLVIDICISLGLYIADRSSGNFANMIMSFSDRPKLSKCSGATLKERLTKLIKSPMGYSTNIQAAYKHLLDTAKAFNATQDDMPTTILIFSDMQFNSTYDISGTSTTAFKSMKASFKASGYEMPKIVFWNLAARTDNAPVKFNQSGVALVSGFSPSLVKSILGGKNFTPKDIMLETVNSTRYDDVK